MVKYYCDWCEKRVNSQSELVYVKVPYFKNICFRDAAGYELFDDKIETQDYDICQRCANKLAHNIVSLKRYKEGKYDL